MLVRKKLNICTVIHRVKKKEREKTIVNKIVHKIKFLKYSKIKIKWERGNRVTNKGGDKWKKLHGRSKLNHINNYIKY